MSANKQSAQRIAPHSNWKPRIVFYQGGWQCYGWGGVGTATNPVAAFNAWAGLFRNVYTEIDRCKES